MRFIVLYSLILGIYRSEKRMIGPLRKHVDIVFNFLIVMLTVKTNSVKTGPFGGSVAHHSIYALVAREK